MKTKKLLALALSGGVAFLTAHAASVASNAAAPADTSAPTPAVAPATPPLTVAVLPFDASDDKLRLKAEEASTFLWAQLSTKPALWMVERSEIDKLLSEHTLFLSGLTDPGTAVKAGNLIGARVLITGRLIRTGDTYVLVAKVMSTETSRVFGATADTSSVDTLNKTAADLSDQVAALLNKESAAFTVAVEAPEARLARLRKLTEGKKLPSVQVKIGEQDVTSKMAIDPAAETEIKKQLSDLGFEIIDPAKSDKVADMVVTGQALTQAGARNGQLVSARGRVELQVTRQSDGKVVAVDRETSVAVDTAPAVAGKTALQNAAATLVERLVPKLIQP